MILSNCYCSVLTALCFNVCCDLIKTTNDSTWMRDRLRVGKPSRYVTSHLGQLSLLSLRGN